MKRIRVGAEKVLGRAPAACTRHGGAYVASIRIVRIYFVLIAKLLTSQASQRILWYLIRNARNTACQVVKPRLSYRL